MEGIAGLEFVKRCINELIVWSMSRPDIFTGLRALPRGLLLFGPPGTGKTMIGKAIANQSGATFFYISASSIGSKWAGESEQLVRTLFAVAAAKQPSVIFIDETDSMLTKRILDFAGRLKLSSWYNLMEWPRLRYSSWAPRIAPTHLTRLFTAALSNESALYPVRAIPDIREAKAEDIRPIQHEDFTQALGTVKASVDLKLFEVGMLNLERPSNTATKKEYHCTR